MVCIYATNGSILDPFLERVWRANKSCVPCKKVVKNLSKVSNPFKDAKACKTISEDNQKMPNYKARPSGVTRGRRDEEQIRTTTNAVNETTDAQTKNCNRGITPISILYKSIAGHYRPVRIADGPITSRYRFIKNTSWDLEIVSRKTIQALNQFKLCETSLLVLM